MIISKAEGFQSSAFLLEHRFFGFYNPSKRFKSESQLEYRLDSKSTFESIKKASYFDYAQ